MSREDDDCPACKFNKCGMCGREFGLPSKPKKLIGWRTENYLWETADVAVAKNWEPNVGVLPIFEGDTNTQLGTTGDAS